MKKNVLKQKNKVETALSEQEIFVQRHKLHHKMIAGERVLLCILFLGIWELSADCGWIDAFFFSSPLRVVRCFLELWTQKKLGWHIMITLSETFFSFLFVMGMSILAATLLYYDRHLSEVLEPSLVMLNSLPKSALAPLFIVWLGSGIPTIIVAGVSVAVFGAIISIYTGFLQVEEEKLTLIRTLGGNRKQAFFMVVLPSAVPVILSCAKVNIGLSLVGVIIGEFLAARRGLGYLIIYGSQVFQLDLVITSILILCLFALLFYRVIQSIEHRMKKKFQG